MPKPETRILDMPLAKKLIRAFCLSTGVDCFLLSLGSSDSITGHFPCRFCRALAQLGLSSGSCLDLHRRSALYAAQFGGRYIYFCPHGLAHFASPILIDGRANNYLIGGPVLILTPEDFLAGLPLDVRLSPKAETPLQEALAAFPHRDPDILNQLSLLLFSVAAQLGNSYRELLLSMESNSVQRSVGEAVQALNAGGSDHFPIEKEQALIAAVSEGDLIRAWQLLNELVGYIFFHSGGEPELIQSMSAELLFTISNTAKQCGVNRDVLLEQNSRHFLLLSRSRSFENTIACLEDALKSYVNLVRNLTPDMHGDAVAQATQYIRQHFCEHLTLETVAAQVSLSPVYFSRLFNRAMGMSFNTYLNQLRVRKSAYLLSATRISVLDIASQCGFDDQSYFSKVFKRYTGTSPTRYRSRPSKIDASLEREVL